jgi:hypothetical protein
MKLTLAIVFFLAVLTGAELGAGKVDRAMSNDCSQGKDSCFPKAGKKCNGKKGSCNDQGCGCDMGLGRRPLSQAVHPSGAVGKSCCGGQGCCRHDSSSACACTSANATNCCGSKGCCHIPDLLTAP